MGVIETVTFKFYELSAATAAIIKYVIYGCCSSRTTPGIITGVSHWRKNIVAVVTQDRAIDDNMK